VEEQPRLPESVMGDLFVLGAGFSRAAARQMPLLRDLPELLRGLRAWSVLHDGWLERFDSNVETLLTYLSQTQPFLSEAENLRNRAEFLDVSKKLGWAVASRQDEAVRNASEPQWLSRLVRAWDASPEMGPTVVITFNYDTLVEKMYQAIRDVQGADVPIDKRRPTPQAADLYPAPLAHLGTRSGVGLLGGDVRRSFSLLKLHGSVNWLYSGSERFFGETIYYVPVVSGWQPDEYAVASYGRAPDKTPFVVPPTTEKSTFFANETVRWQWEQARNELTFAHRVFFIGYSLPQTDLLVRFLFSSLDPRVEIHLVNRLERTLHHAGRSDDRIRDDFIHHYTQAFPRQQVVGEFVRVDQDVLEDFVASYVAGTI